MAEDVTRIKTFARKIMLAPLAEAMSAIADPMVFAGNWESVGLYDQEVGLSFSEERVQFKPHGKVAAIVQKVIKKAASFTLSLGETDIHHIKRALSSAVENSGVLEDGGVSTINFLSWAIETDNGVYHFKKGAGDGNLDLTIPDDDIAKLDLTINCIADSNLTEGVQIYEYHDFKALGV